MTLNAEEVRSIVREENRAMREAITELSGSMKQLSEGLQRLIASERVTDEKFTRVHERVDVAEDLAKQANESNNHLTSHVLPQMENQITVNAFSVRSFWLAITPVLGIAGAIITFLYLHIGQKDALIIGMLKAAQ